MNRLLTILLVIGSIMVHVYSQQTQTYHYVGIFAIDNQSVANLNITKPSDTSYALSYLIIIKHNDTTPTSTVTVLSNANNENITLVCESSWTRVAATATTPAGFVCNNSMTIPSTDTANYNLVGGIIASPNNGNASISISYSEAGQSYGNAVLTMPGSTNVANTTTTGTTAAPTTTASQTSATSSPGNGTTTGAGSQLLPSAIIGFMLILLAVL